MITRERLIPIAVPAKLWSRWLKPGLKLISQRGFVNLVMRIRKGTLLNWFIPSKTGPPTNINAEASPIKIPKKQLSRQLVEELKLHPAILTATIN